MAGNDDKKGKGRPPNEFSPLHKSVEFHDLAGSLYQGRIIYLTDGWLFLKTVESKAETKEPNSIIGLPADKIEGPIIIL